MSDPTVRWGFSHLGTIQWSDLPIHDDASAHMMREAARHGLIHGFTVAVSESGTRSVASFARSDRAATEAELAHAHDQVQALHAMTGSAADLPEDLEDILTAISIQLTRGTG